MESNRLEPQQPEPGAQDVAPSPPKKPYATPTLIVHGTIEEITGGLFPGNADGAAMGS